MSGGYRYFFPAAWKEVEARAGNPSLKHPGIIPHRRNHGAHSFARLGCSWLELASRSAMAGLVSARIANSKAVAGREREDVTIQPPSPAMND
jgi:hypothetical protein